jgi:hypothetical protein
MRNLLRPTAMSLILAAGVSARSTSLEPFLMRGMGSTLFRFEMAFPITGVEDVPEGTQALVQSELEYPLDMFVAGLKWRFEPGGGETGRGMGFTLGAWTNLSGPAGWMKDTDWFGTRVPSGSGTRSRRVMVSYTESTAEPQWYGGEAGWDIGPYPLLTWQARYGLSVRAERLEYSMTGVKGWQRLPDGGKIPIDALSGRQVLTYELTRVMPRFSADVLLAEGRIADWGATLTAAPAFAWDHDDHVLRNKYSDSFVFGFEAGARSEIAFRVSDRSRLVAAGELAYLRATGTMDQHFYGDDPGTPDRDETGSGFKNVETRIIGFGGGISVGYRRLF